MVSHDHTLLGNLVLTDAGVATLHEADHIFALGELLPQRVREAASGPTLRLNLGISDGIAKLAVHRLLTPALDEPHRRLLCHEGEFQPLLSELALPAGVLADTTDRRRLVSGALLAQTVAGALLILLVGLSLVVWALSLAGRSTHATAPPCSAASGTAISPPCPARIRDNQGHENTVAETGPHGVPACCSCRVW